MMKYLLAIMTLAGISMTTSAASADVRICKNGICIGTDGRNVDVHPDYRDYRRPPRYNPPHRPPPHYPPHRPPPPRYPSNDYVRCESYDGRYNTCRYDNWRVRRISLVQQNSRAACVYGRSWGYTGYNIWTDYGCRGVFLVERY